MSKNHLIEPKDDPVAVPSITYYVFPLLPDSNSRYLKCRYATKVPNQFPENYVEVSVDRLFFGSVEKKLILIQLAYADAIVIFPGATLDTQSKLFAAIVKTKIGSIDDESGKIIASSDGTLTIDVTYPYRRSLILAFSRPTDDGFALYTTGDPEIKPDPTR